MQRVRAEGLTKTEIIARLAFRRVPLASRADRQRSIKPRDLHYVLSAGSCRRRTFPTPGGSAMHNEPLEYCPPGDEALRFYYLRTNDGADRALERTREILRRHRM